MNKVTASQVYQQSVLKAQTPARKVQFGASPLQLKHIQRLKVPGKFEKFMLQAQKEGKKVLEKIKDFLDDFFNGTGGTGGGGGRRNMELVPIPVRSNNFNLKA